ncbi:MAG: tRNA 4-thiouridine(8) synthase ThiI, partial [Sulfurovum sp.]
MVKGSSAKKQMIGQLYNNLIKLLGEIDSDIAIKKFSDKLEVVTPIKVVNRVRERLLNTSGIEQVLEALQFDNMENLEDIKAKVCEISASEIVDKTFVVRAKRSGKHDFNSSEMERTIGGYMLAHTPSSKGVDLHNPDVTIKIELINNQLNIITQKHMGLGGFPIGTQGDVLSLMSGGFDSTVASYLTMRRGLKTHYIFFNLGGIAHEIGVKQVSFYLWNKFGASHRVKIVSVPFDDVLTEIFRSTPETYMGVTLKRLMILAAQKIADEMEIDALVTGESIAQVSSQTLRNLSLIDQVSQKLIIRPLATVDKPEIIQLATKIGTRHFAENMPEYCGVISKNPITHGSFKRMEKEAKRFNYEVLDKAVENAVSIYVDEVVNDVNRQSPVEVISELKEEYVVIDIRPEEETISSELCETIKIPFHKLKTEFKKLPKNREYLLYCEKGVMSQLHAQYLNDSQEDIRVRVYR